MLYVAYGSNPQVAPLLPEGDVFQVLDILPLVLEDLHFSSGSPLPFSIECVRILQIYS